MDLKLHISKAYDRVDWVFLRGVMATMGFPSNWINLLMRCVSTMPYFFLVNGSPFGYLRPKRGLRQEDPLFPYPFLSCVEGLSALLTKYGREGKI